MPARPGQTATSAFRVRPGIFETRVGFGSDALEVEIEQHEGRLVGLIDDVGGRAGDDAGLLLPVHLLLGDDRHFIGQVGPQRAERDRLGRSEPDDDIGELVEILDADATGTSTPHGAGRRRH